MFAIIIHGTTKKLDIIDLNDWNSWEWDDFNSLRDNDNNGEILTFLDEEDAVEFLLDNFDEALIEPEWVKRLRYVPSGYSFSLGMTAK